MKFYFLVYITASIKNAKIYYFLLSTLLKLFKIFIYILLDATLRFLTELRHTLIINAINVKMP